VINSLVFAVLLATPQVPTEVVDARYNGIEVGKIAVWNDASLRSRFARLASQLSTILQIDASQIREGLFKSQAGFSSSRGSAFGLQTVPLPSIESVVSNSLTTASGQSNTGATTSTSSTSGVDANGKATSSQTNTTGTTATTTGPTTSEVATTSDKTIRPSVNPNTPSLDLKRSPFDPKSLSLDAISRVGEYTSLYYEVTNLQMVVERALSHVVDLSSQNRVDRLRVPVVIGIPVSIDPAPNQKDCVAEVEINVALEGDTQQNAGHDKNSDPPKDLFVTALMPQERSYNVARVVSNQQSASFGAVFSIINLGFATGKASDKAFISKDYDTVAMNFFGNESLEGPVKFGWQFRPVFDQQAVEPGRRQLFVGLSLPPFSEKREETLTFTMTTRWRKLGRGRRTVSRDFVGSSTVRKQKVVIRGETLEPQLEQVHLAQGLQGQVFATVDGSGFFDGMDLVVGGRIIPASNYLNFGSKSLKIALTADEIVEDEVASVSVFGPIKPLTGTIEEKGRNLKNEFTSEMTARVVERDDDSCRVTLWLPSNWQSIFDRWKPVVATGGRLFGLGTKIHHLRKIHNLTTGEVKDVTVLEVTVPTQAFLQNSLVRVSIPFASFPDGSPAKSSFTPTFDSQSHLGFDVSSAKKTGERKLDIGGDAYVFTLTGRGLDNVFWSIPGDVLKRPIPGAAPDGAKVDDTPQGYYKLSEKQQEKGRDQLRILDGRNAMAGNSRIRQLVIPKAYFKETNTIVLVKELVIEGFILDTFTRVVTLQLKQEPKPVVLSNAIDPVEQNYVGAVRIKGENLGRIQAIRWNGEELKIIHQNASDPATEAWYVELPAEFADKLGNRSLVFVLDDSSEIVQFVRIVAKT
jgi:hypothetical protein